MRFFHLSDLHIGKQLHGYNMNQDQQMILKQIVEKAEELKPDMVIIAGDIYDKSVPSAEAVSLFDEFLTELANIKPSIPVLAIAGNHDSPERLEFASRILGRNNIYIAGMPPRTSTEYIKKVTFYDEFGEIDVYLLPFMKPGYVRNVFLEPIESYDEAVRKIIEREKIDYTRRNILLSHQFYTSGTSETQRCASELISIGGIDNVDVSAVEKFDYVALGHIHGPQRIGQEHIRYSGTPLKYSVSEQNHKKALMYVTVGSKNSAIELEKIELEPLRDVREIRGSLAEVVSLATRENKDDYVSVTLTDEDDSVYRPKEQLMDVYSHILEIRVDNARTRGAIEETEAIEQLMDPLQAFEKFFAAMQLREITDDEREIMLEVVNKAKESE